ncbi:hypothetical protein ACTWQB_14820 [Piscibacillus sp. B03]|uniref:hypothetical protein n=1 Tax=Piscibacillus sp. B03 TaxID=3457430 RepID=UPI003FCCDC10
MSYGELTKWEQRLQRALKSHNVLQALDNMRRDLQDAYDLQDPVNHRELQLYNRVKQLMLEQEVA